MKFTSLGESLSQMLLVDFRRVRDNVTHIKNTQIRFIGEDDQIHLGNSLLLRGWKGSLSTNPHVQCHLVLGLVGKILH